MASGLVSVECSIRHMFSREWGDVKARVGRRRRAAAARIKGSHGDAPRPLASVIKLLSNNMPQIELTH